MSLEFRDNEIEIKILQWSYVSVRYLRHLSLRLQNRSRYLIEHNVVFLLYRLLEN